MALHHATEKNAPPLEHYVIVIISTLSRHRQRCSPLLWRRRVAWARPAPATAGTIDGVAYAYPGLGPGRHHRCLDHGGGNLCHRRAAPPDAGSRLTAGNPGRLPPNRPGFTAPGRPQQPIRPVRDKIGHPVRENCHGQPICGHAISGCGHRSHHRCRKMPDQYQRFPPNGQSVTPPAHSAHHTITGWASNRGP